MGTPIELWTFGGDHPLWSEEPERKAGINVTMCRYSGRMEGGEPKSDVPWEIAHHSPTGFEWGYGGSGPADLALNILYQFVDFPRAWKMHQQFKWDFIAPMPEGGGAILKGDIWVWIEKQEATG